MYGAWNVYKTYMPNINTNRLAVEIFNKLSPNNQKKLLDELNTEQEPDLLPYNQALIDFKRSRINITELLHIISESYIDDA